VLLPTGVGVKVVMDSPAINTDYLEWGGHEFPQSIKENILEVFKQF
jgi:hypothetical protein